MSGAGLELLENHELRESVFLNDIVDESMVELQMVGVKLLL